jgi:RNA polymerase sigma-70 factor (ECF subfamily)
MSADRALVEAVLANAPGAFERLVRQHQRLCWHIIYRIVRHRQDAEDLCQETFLRVHRYLHQYRFESALNTWIGQIAYSVALRYMERRRIPLIIDAENVADVSTVENVGDNVDIEAVSITTDIVEHVHEALERLPPLQRTLMTLYHIEELSIADISRVTGLADGTIKSHLYRARLRLRTVLKAFLGEIP